MYDIDNEFNKKKYFLDFNKEKIYASKGSGHKALAYRILRSIGLDMIYYNCYEETVPAAMFLIYCGYVLVDEAEVTYKPKQEGEFWEYEEEEFTTVGYCSASIDKEYVEYLKNEYGSQENVIEDAYATENIREKHKIDEIIAKVKPIMEQIKKYESREQYGDER